MKVSVALPVHNEEKYLPYSLGSLVDAPIDELVVVLDRCSDHSKEIVERFKNEWSTFPVEIYEKSWHRWRYKAEAWQFAFAQATSDIVYGLGADLCADHAMFNLAPFKDANVALTNYRYYPCNLTKFDFNACWDTVLLKLLDRISPYKGSQRSGVFALRKSVWEQLGGFADVPSEVDVFRQAVVDHGYTFVHDPSTKVLHLRGGYDRARQYLQGVARWQQLSYPLWKVVAHCFLHFKPHVLPGYLHSRRN